MHQSAGRVEPKGGGAGQSAAASVSGGLVSNNRCYMCAAGGDAEAAECGYVWELAGVESKVWDETARCESPEDGCSACGTKCLLEPWDGGRCAGESRSGEDR